MKDRPEHFRYSLHFATVAAVYADSWEADLLTEDGGTIYRAIVQGPRMPEVSTPTRPQWAIFGFAHHEHGSAICWPFASRLTNIHREQWVYYEEVLNFRITINRDNELEIRNTNGDVLCQLRIQQIDGVIRLDTPGTRLVLKEADKSIDLHCDEDLTASVGGDASIDVDGDLDATVGGAATVTVEGDATIESKATLNLKGATVNIEGATAVNITGGTVNIN